MLYQINDFIKRVCNKLITRSVIKTFGSAGKNISIMEGFFVRGNKNVYMKNDISIGPNAIFMCTRAKIQIGDHVMFGPNVKMITGNHRIDLLGKYMIDVKDNEKLPENDEPIILEGDNWIGANVTILKGVTVGRGSVIAANSLLNKSVPPYAVYGGIPARLLKMRFSEEEIQIHNKLLCSDF